MTEAYNVKKFDQYRARIVCHRRDGEHLEYGSTSLIDARQFVHDELISTSENIMIYHYRKGRSMGLTDWFYHGVRAK